MIHPLPTVYNIQILGRTPTTHVNRLRSVQQLQGLLAQEQFCPLPPQSQLLE
ncbi:hypothetical protein K474DRAFT_1659320 [Panus rudis PR-1116 ss-1]|nr:hypothetical protein K474DRAFT_1659320 [Panus rudis PR-1116 ss-1]